MKCFCVPLVTLSLGDDSKLRRTEGLVNIDFIQFLSSNLFVGILNEVLCNVYELVCTLCAALEMYRFGIWRSYILHDHFMRISFEWNLHYTRIYEIHVSVCNVVCNVYFLSIIKTSKTSQKLHSELVWNSFELHNHWIWNRMACLSIHSINFVESSYKIHTVLV